MLHKLTFHEWVAAVRVMVRCWLSLEGVPDADHEATLDLDQPWREWYDGDTPAQEAAYQIVHHV